MTKQTTIGQLVANLFGQFEDQYHDEELAAVATQVIVDDVMRARGRRDGNRRTTVVLRRKVA